MTGFGQASLQSPLGKLAVEIRSLNHRFFDAVLHLPNGFNLLDDRIRKELQRNISRGRINLSFSFVPMKAQKIVLNDKLAANYVKALRGLGKKLKLKDDLGLSHLFGLQGVLNVNEQSLQLQQMWPLIKKTLDMALDNLIHMREAEGDSIEADLRKHVMGLDSSLQMMSKQAKNVIRKKSKLLSPEDCSMFLKSVDINEEIERLNFHIKNFRLQQKKKRAVGKELDFIAQEMQREINTIGAKLPDSKISYFVITMKSLVEKMREQLQNVE